MLKAFSFISIHLVIFTALCFSQQTKTVTVTISDPASVSLETLFAQADLVAFVKIRSGDVESYDDAVYKAVVLKAYKGSKVDDVIYFTPFIGYGIGSEYLVFLKKTNRHISDIVSEDSKKKSQPYDSTQGFYRIMYDGYSVMSVSYECVFEESIRGGCDYTVLFNIKHVNLPSKLKTFPKDGVQVEFSDLKKFVKRNSIEPVLESLGLKN